MTPAEQITGVVFDIQRYAIYDGPGIRTSVYLKGCPLRCAWCHNPESWRRAPERAFRASLCTGCGQCVEACESGALSQPGPGLPVTHDAARCVRCLRCAEVCETGATERVGREMTVAEVLADVVPDRAFFETSGGGLTVSGGEPTHQYPFLLALLDGARAESLHTAVETCGHFPAARLEELADRVDLFLFDLKHPDDTRHLDLTGVSGEGIRANFETLVTRVGASGLLARVPLVPGVNDDRESVADLVDFLRQAEYPGRVELMPYNATARQKWQKMGLGSQYTDYGHLSDPSLERVQAQVAEAGFETFVNH